MVNSIFFLRESDPEFMHRIIEPLQNRGYSTRYHVPSVEQNLLSHIKDKDLVFIENGLNIDHLILPLRLLDKQIAIIARNPSIDECISYLRGRRHLGLTVLDYIDYNAPVEEYEAAIKKVDK